MSQTETGPNLVADLIENEPAPNEGIVAAIEAMKEQENGNVQNPTQDNAGVAQPQTVPQSQGEQSAAGTGTSTSFDPSIHEVNADGTPRRTITGAFRRKRGQRPKVASNAAYGPAGSVAQPNTVDYSGMADFVLTLMFGTCERMLGDHWKPAPDEHKEIHKQTVRVLTVNNVPDLPPSIALAIALGMYAIPRAFHPETKQRLHNAAVSLGIRQPMGPYRMPATEPQVINTGETEIPNPDNIYNRPVDSVDPRTAREMEMPERNEDASPIAFSDIRSSDEQPPEQPRTPRKRR